MTKNFVQISLPPFPPIVGRLLREQSSLLHWKGHGYAKSGMRTARHDSRTISFARKTGSGYASSGFSN